MELIITWDLEGTAANNLTLLDVTLDELVVVVLIYEESRDAERRREILMIVKRENGVQIGVEDNAIKDRLIEFSVLVA